MTQVIDTMKKNNLDNEINYRKELDSLKEVLDYQKKPMQLNDAGKNRATRRELQTLIGSSTKLDPLDH